MKWIYAILLLISATAFGQSDVESKYIRYQNQYGMRLPRFWSDSILRAAGLVKFTGIGASTDTATHKPIAVDASGNVVKFPHWPGGGGGSDTTNKWVNNLRRRGDTDSVEIFKNGAWQFAYYDSTGIYRIYKNNTGFVTPSALTFKAVNAARIVDLMPEQFKLFELNPLQTYGNNAPFANVDSAGGTYSSIIANQRFVSSASGTGAYCVTNFYASPKFSWWTMKIGLDGATGNGTLQAGLIKDRNNMFGFSLNQTTNKISYYVAVAGVSTLSAGVTLTNTTPFEVNISCTGAGLKLYINYTDGTFQDIPLYDVIDSAGVDMRATSFYDGSYKFGIFTYSASSTTSYSFNYLKGGYFGSTGIGDFQVINTDYGQPYTRDGKLFFSASLRGYTGGSTLVAFSRNNGFGVVSVDQNNYQIKLEAVHALPYRDTFAICGANGYVYDTKTHKFLCLLPSFGPIEGDTFTTAMMRYGFVDDDITRGAYAFDSLNAILTNEIAWDPTATKINGEWYIGYATTHVPYSQYTHTWIKIIKTTDFSSFTTIGEDIGSTNNWEGIKTAKIGDSIFFIASGHTDVRLYHPTTAAYSQSIPQTIVITDYPSNHACIFPVMYKGKTKYWWLSFNRDDFNSNLYTYGDAVLFISDQSETGYEFPIRNYLR